MKLKLPVIFGFYFLIISAFLIITAAGNKAVSVVAENLPVERQHTIIIDAGHGGIDGGATSCTGMLESEINLAISLRLNDLFHLLGYETVMIRTTDTSVYTQGNTIASQKVSDLKERVRIVNSTGNGTLVSIHQNTFSDSRYNGAQVFYSENLESKALADALQRELITALNPGSNRKSKKADGIYLMEHIECTGILVECGFLSNPEEEAKLRSKEYQNRLCSVIAAVVCDYLTNT
ncbi:MAG: N-acetylmuramoyl-L-alanine amidase [Oscillospiraceae bacterium]|nr:N-acetylmuramoyl-L-alanine amidase [Oscillospiraceae bacterium]